MKNQTGVLIFHTEICAGASQIYLMADANWTFASPRRVNAPEWRINMGKFRILVKGIVQYKDSYLAVERWYDDRIFEPYQWEFIDGEMEFGETPEKAVERIVEEKTGIPVQVDKILYTWGFTAGEICTAGIAFLCDAQTDQVVLSEELHDSKWVAKDEITNVITNQAVVKDIERAGLTNSFDLDDFGKVDLFIEPMD